MKLYKYYRAKGTIREKVFRRVPFLKKRIRIFAWKKIVKGVKAQDMIADWIKSGKPFMVARFGSVELRCTAECDQYNEKKEKAFCAKTWKSMGNNAGLFPITEENLVRFGALMKDCCSQVDLLGAWFMLLEDYMLRNYMKDTILTRLWSLEPYRFDNPWTMALEGKKVLLVHPFTETIKRQYERREKVWQKKAILPTFELQTLKAVQTAAGERDARFDDWFEALDYMKVEIAKRDFDIAIIGCGAYGFPLAAYVKELGKQAIHLGGATQLLFGIRGKRWENDPGVNTYFNECWVRPSAEETPKNYNAVEGGCYW